MQHRNIPAGLRHHSHLRANMDFTQVFSKTGISEMSSPLPTSCLQHPPTPARCSRSIRRRYLRGFKVTSTGNGPKADPTDPFKHHKTVKHGWLMLTILVGGWATPLKNISQLGWLFPIYWKKRNVPNHQSADYRSILILWKWDPIWSSVPPCLVWWSWNKLITCPRSVKWSCSHSPADRPKNPSRIHGRNITAIESLCDTATHAWEVSRGFQGACLILIRSEEHIRAVVTSMELHDPHPTTCILYVFITERAIRQDQPRENSAGNKSLSGKASWPLGPRIEHLNHHTLSRTITPPRGPLLLNRFDSDGPWWAVFIVGWTGICTINIYKHL